MSIIIIRRDNASEYAIHHSAEKVIRSQMQEICGKRWPKGEIVYYLDVYDLRGSNRSYRGWVASLQDALNGLRYNTDGWITNDFIFLTTIIADIFSTPHSPAPYSQGTTSSEQPKARRNDAPRNPRPARDNTVERGRRRPTPAATSATTDISTEQLAMIVAAVVKARDDVVKPRASRPAAAPADKKKNVKRSVFADLVPVKPAELAEPAVTPEPVKFYIPMSMSPSTETKPPVEEPEELKNMGHLDWAEESKQSNS